MKVDLKNQEVKLRLNSHCACVDSLSYKSFPILFPKVFAKIGEELLSRGGINFDFLTKTIYNKNPKEKFDYEKFGSLQIIKKEDHALSLKMEGKDDFKNIFLYLDYILQDNKFSTHIKLENFSGNDLEIYPLFMIYFYCREIDREVYDWEYKEGKSLDLEICENSIKISSLDVLSYYIEKDSHGDYLSLKIRPQDNQIEKEKVQILKTDEKFTMDLTIEINWKPFIKIEGFLVLGDFMEEKKEKSLLKLFISTLYLSAFTFGGGYVIASLMKTKFVDELGRIDKSEMLDMLAIAQSAPGAMAVNTSIVIGYKVFGPIGAVVSVLGTALPPLIIISVISLIYERFAANRYIALMLKGMQAGVCALIIKVVIDMGRDVLKDDKKLGLIIMISSFIVGFVFKVNVIYIILTLILLGAIYSLLGRSKDAN